MFRASVVLRAMESLYGVLGVEKNASASEVRASFVDYNS